MAPAEITRKLTAILTADVVGYSRLMRATRRGHWRALWPTAPS